MNLDHDQIDREAYFGAISKEVTDLIHAFANNTLEHGPHLDDEALLNMLAFSMSVIAAQEGGDMIEGRFSIPFTALAGVAGALKARSLRRALHLSSLQSGVAN